MFIFPFQRYFKAGIQLQVLCGNDHYQLLRFGTVSQVSSETVIFLEYLICRINPLTNWTSACRAQTRLHIGFEALSQKVLWTLGRIKNPSHGNFPLRGYPPFRYDKIRKKNGVLGQKRSFPPF